MALIDVWLEIGHDHQVIIVLNFDNMIKARKFCKGLISHLKGQGINSRVSNHWVRPDTGMFEVSLQTDCTDSREVIEKATNPPCSNRGVTT